MYTSFESLACKRDRFCFYQTSSECPLWAVCFVTHRLQNQVESDAETYHAYQTYRCRAERKNFDFSKVAANVISVHTSRKIWPLVYFLQILQMQETKINSRSIPVCQNILLNVCCTITFYINCKSFFVCQIYVFNSTLSRVFLTKLSFTYLYKIVSRQNTIFSSILTDMKKFSKLIQVTQFWWLSQARVRIHYHSQETFIWSLVCCSLRLYYVIFQFQSIM